MYFKEILIPILEQTIICTRTQRVFDFIGIFIRSPPSASLDEKKKTDWRKEILIVKGYTKNIVTWSHPSENIKVNGLFDIRCKQVIRLAIG